MISAIDRKLLRDLWQVKGQVLAIVLILMCGVTAFVMTRSALVSLEQTRAAYYDRHRFADVFARVKRAPRSLADRVAEIPGVVTVSTRVVQDVTLDVRGLPEPAVGRLISLPEYDAAGDLNTVYLRLGRFPDPARDDEVLASEAFTVANKLEPGDTVSAIINGRKKLLRIVGVALAPEYIFQMRQGDFFPDDKRFAVMWMPRRPLEFAFDLRGAFNDLTLTLAPGAVEKEVLRQLDDLTAEYGGTGAVGRDEQLSHKFVSDEFENLKNISRIAPNIFLGVAAFLLNVVLSRLVTSQREQIAALKAFGYSSLAVGWHYLKFALVIVALGLVGGMIGGILQGQWMTSLYQKFYRFPILLFHYEPSVFIEATVIALIAAGVGTLGAVRRAVTLPPAEAMRPPSPPRYRATLAERIGLARLLSPGARMVLRNLERKPISAALSILGLGFGSAVLIMGFFIGDAFDWIVDIQFDVMQRQTVSVSFVEPRPGRINHELAHLPGVIAAEPFRAVAAKLRHGPRSKRLAVRGLVGEPRLLRLIDESLHAVALPPEGLVLGDELAKILDVRAGESVSIEVLEGQRPIREVTVSLIVKEIVGANAYMRIDALNRLMGESDAVSGGYLIADSNELPNLYATLKERPALAAAQVKSAMVQNFNDIQQENMRIIRSFYVTFGIIIAVGVVYNAAQVSLAERSRDLASLRVLGFTRGEISAILLGELAVLVLASLPVGQLLGQGLAYMIAKSVESEAIRMPVVIFPATYSVAAIVILASAVASALIVRRKLDKLDLVAVLKTQY
ncbi:MAG: FtsX-like permease family protein [Gemmataceae bacterium]|nr:FtsX-like permease family protein [Gemmataceae bacterium]